MTMAQRIEDKLLAALPIEQLEVRNDSHRHAGHVGSPHTGESHFHLTIKSAELTSLSRVAAQRKVYQTLKNELAAGIHALSMDITA